MLEMALAQLQIASSVLLARPFSERAIDRLIAGLLATRKEFGAFSAQAIELAAGPIVDADSQRAFQRQRFRGQAKRAAQETAFYEQLFSEQGIDPGRLDWPTIAQIPLTTKAMLRADGDACVRQNAQPAFCAMTSGTTGKPIGIWFSQRELRTYESLGAISLLTSGKVTPEDVVQFSTSARALLGNSTSIGACLRVGAGVYQTGIIEPEGALQRLAQVRHAPGKKAQASVLHTYPSYLGRLVETGLRLGYGPRDFGLEAISLGGEITTAGSKARAQQLFGQVRFDESYGMTEPWPCGGLVCEQGHLHFDATHGLVEVLRLGSDSAALPGEAGRLVITPFAPFRETTLVLRYDTEDVVMPVTGPLSCTLRHLPATSNVLGKLPLAVQHDQGWTFPRQILEALEALDVVPLPARCGFWAVPGGVAVETVVRTIAPAVHDAVADRLTSQGVPVQELHLTTDPADLGRPLPWRGDLHEASFGASGLSARVPDSSEIKPQ